MVELRRALTGADAEEHAEGVDEVEGVSGREDVGARTGYPRLLSMRVPAIQSLLYPIVPTVTALKIETSLGLKVERLQERVRRERLTRNRSGS